MRPLLAALFLFAPLAACDSGDGLGGSALRYELELREDGSSSPVATGELRLDAAPVAGQAVTGTFTLQRAGGGPFPPFSTTAGPLDGNVEADGDLVVRLTVPNASDIGLRLEGQRTGSAYSGAWSEITIAGPQPRGTFTATSGG